jgi:hypothetical protein
VMLAILTLFSTLVSQPNIADIQIVALQVVTNLSSYCKEKSTAG